MGGDERIPSGQVVADQEPAAAAAGEAEVRGHAARGVVRLEGEAVPVDLKTEDAGFEAQPGPGAFRRALERLVGDEGYREEVLADPGRLVGDFGLDPGRAGLLAAACWAAYGPEVAGHYRAW